ncbi:MAG: hypothetical protein ACK6CU_11640 [Deltaproteobacteria bacterium]
MVKKVSYRAVPIERLTSALLAAMLVGVSKLVVAIDVAKLKMMAGFGSEDGSIARLVLPGELVEGSPAEIAHAA